MHRLRLAALFVSGLALTAQARAEVAVPMVQLPYKSPQQARAMLDDLERRFSWSRAKNIIERYVPPEIRVLGHPRAWLSYHAVCYREQTAAACQPALSLIVYTMEQKEELGWTRMRIIGMDEIPYRDPAPIDAIAAALDYSNGTPAMTHEEAAAALAPFLDPTLIVDAPEGSGFNYSRALCVYPQYANIPNTAPYFVHCHAYATELASVMRERATLRRAFTSPFGR